MDVCNVEIANASPAFKLAIFLGYLMDFFLSYFFLIFGIKYMDVSYTFTVILLYIEMLVFSDAWTRP